MTTGPRQHRAARKYLLNASLIGTSLNKQDTVANGNRIEFAPGLAQKNPPIAFNGNPFPNAR